MPVQVLLVDDHTVVRSGIRALLESSKDVTVVGEAANGREAVAMSLTLRPQVVLMDLAMDELNGIEATRQITTNQRTVGILMLSMHNNEEYVYEALKAGAKGYVLKSAAVFELLKAIREVAAGRNYISPSLAGMVMDDYVRRAKGTARQTGIEKLTPREREILQLIAEGRSSVAIADRIHISVRTVETHRKNIMEKTAIRSIAGLTRLAIRHGITQLQ